MPVSKTHFDGIDGADLSAFLKGLHQFIAEQHPGTTWDPEDVDARTTTLCAQLETIAGQPGPTTTKVLRFLAELEVSGLFDKLLFGAGTITGKSQPYSLHIADLSQIDPFCLSVSVMQFKKGDPWFAFDVSDVAQDQPSFKVFARKIHKKKTELVWSQAMTPSNLQAFLWSWFARPAQGMQFTDSPDINDDTIQNLVPLFTNAIHFSEQAALFESPNTYVAVFFTSLGWVTAFTIPDVNQPHALTPTILAMLDSDPNLIAGEISHAIAAAKN